MADVARYAGLLLFTLGGVLRIAAIVQLGRRFSALVAIQPDHALKTDGLYRYVRHPRYLGAIVAAVGWSLIFRGGTGLLLTAAMLLVLIGRIRAEEQFLADELGDEYRAFQRQTRWRLLPGVY